jgi:hypothetical protein
MNTNIADPEMPETFFENVASAEESEAITPTAEALGQRVSAERLLKLTSRARTALAKGAAANLEAGRAYNELKPLFKHGTWIPFLEAEAAQFGISVRTIQDHMARAKRDDEQLKNAESALFTPATDQWASEMNAAGEIAAQAVAAAIGGDAERPAPNKSRPARAGKVRLDGNFKLRLWLTVDQQDAVTELMKLESWPQAQQALVETLDELIVLHGIVNPERPANDGDGNERFEREAQFSEEEEYGHLAALQ